MSITELLAATGSEGFTKNRPPVNLTTRPAIAASQASTIMSTRRGPTQQLSGAILSSLLGSISTMHPATTNGFPGKDDLRALILFTTLSSVGCFT